MAVTHMAIFDNIRGVGNCRIIDLTEMKARILAHDTEYRKAWAEVNTPAGYRFTMIIPKETPGAEPIALWRGDGV